LPTIDDRTETTAAPEDVWKLLYDPTRFPAWWTGWERVTARDDKGGDADITMYPDGYPDFPMPHHLHSDPSGGRVSVSCTISDVSWLWSLHPLDGGGTAIAVHADVGPADAERVPAITEMAQTSLRNLARLAAQAG